MLETLLLAALAALAASAPAGERFPPLPPESMTADQKRVAESIMGTRKSLSGPFSVWLRSPELADRLQKVGEYVRFDSSLPKRLSELAIMVTARQWTSQLEWHLHYREAVNAGIRPALLADLAVSRRPAGMDADEALVHDFSVALHRDRGRVPDPLLEAVRSRFGDRGVVDLIGINAYYGAVAMTINAAEVGLPPGVEPPLASAPEASR